MNNIEIVIDKKDKNYGGTSNILIGSPGCGKTNGIGRMCEIDNKKMIALWRGKFTCQWYMFYETGNELVFWLHEGAEYTFFDKDKKIKKLDDIGEIRMWSDPEYLVKNLDKNKINVVYVKHGVGNDKDQLGFIKEWNGIFEAMLFRDYPDEISIHFDEIEDLAPESKPGFYVQVTTVANNIKEFRKVWIHLNGASHKETEIFWVVRNKVVWYTRMAGSKSNKNSKLYRHVLNALKCGQAYIENDNRFDFVKFTLMTKNKRNFILKSKIKEI